MGYHCGLERTCDKSSNCNYCTNYYALVWENEIKFKYALRDKKIGYHMSWPDDNTTSGSQGEFWTGVNYSLKSLKAQKLNG